MKVGDIVVSIHGPHSSKEGALRSGCEAYDNAVIVSMEPFILVSQYGDMMWSTTMKAQWFKVDETAHYDTSQAFARYIRSSKGE